VDDFLPVSMMHHRRNDVRKSKIMRERQRYCAKDKDITSILYQHAVENAQPVAFGVSFNRSLHSQSCWSLFNGTWQTGTRMKLSFENEKVTL